LTLIFTLVILLKTEKPTTVYIKVIATFLYHFHYLFNLFFVLLQFGYNLGNVYNSFFMSVHISSVPLAKASDTITIKIVKVSYFNHYQLPSQLKSLIFWDITPCSSQKVK
jgi:hypothetical protein